MITLIDYGVGNIFAFQNVYKRLDIPTKIAKTHEDLSDAKKLILPGVGSFDYAMGQLNASGMRDKLDLTRAELQEIFDGENKTFHDYKNKIKLIGFGTQMMQKLGLEKRLFR